jgi:hypothetical protein
MYEQPQRCEGVIKMRELLQQALAVLKEWDALIKYQYGGSSEAMTAMQNVAWRTIDTIEGLEAELAKPEQEFKYTEYGLRGDENGNLSIGEISRKPWVGLTIEDIANARIECGANDRELPFDFCYAIEAKLKERNEN